MCWFGVGDGSYTADGVRTRMVTGTISTQNSSKSQFLEVYLQRPLRTGASSERICLFLPLLGAESKNKDDFLSHTKYILRVDGSDFWASEMAEKPRN